VLACGYSKGLDGADATHSCDQVGEKSEWWHKLDLGDVRAHYVHKKCDARQPCTTCVNKNKSTACKYEGSRSSGNMPLRPLMPRPKDVLGTGSGSSEPGSSGSLFVGSHERPSSPQERFERGPPPPILEKVDRVLPPGGSAAQKALDVAKWSPRSIEPSFKILPSIHFRAIPRPLRMPLSLIPPERVQVSRATGSDLDMALYVFSLRARKFSSDRRD
jgi:hypothetical protein